MLENAKIEMTRRFLTEREVEKMFPVKRKTLQNWRFLGRGPAYHKRGRSVFYRYADVEDYFSQGRIDPEAG